ncbi:tripartite tricarboxylate transporter substrate binding protein [Achromobacter sp. Marseille-Q0513]|uniref:tripartite tricarboxylate transporter substrate binding protein n=1 Tax=Achromobacter sp. Marseille-Q0513 TaxID=2829161 RepID=UPI001B8F4BC1|nr:tripartite tricarboxylate transporter substrate binding protein [Achromobacter sp. Marseille-Q0513]MBR8653350.1 tripartite tricarboxylate transporter substrate binding protein [Achromobacter sp. Marseille-Q0513]
MKLLNLLLLSAACCGAAAQAADSYPTKSIELVVSYQPGGGSDSTARAIADAARPLMPQSVVVLNRPGGSGSIGWSYVAGSDDGYRLILMTPEMLVVPLMGIGKVTVGDFQPIARFTDDPSSITVRADAPWRTAQEFIQYVKANPGKVTFSNAGNGTIPHVAAGAFAEAIGARLEHIPYNGSAPAIMGLLAGDVQATTVAYAELRQYVESGKLRTLAVMSEKRVAGLDAPTLKELGHDLQFSVWRGLGLPRNAPREAVEKWRAVSRELATSPKFQETMTKQNLTPSYADTPAFVADIERQNQAVKTLMPKLNLKQ